ncbi:hypothetical protein BDF19DRAFT_493823 [Syncephalis fuscata]|nr:hypothetical protein BDF19DRAFT_493823 [Syncephalis fuscata]
MLVVKVFVLLLCCIPLVFSAAVVRVGNQTFQYHTQDLFEVEVTPYTTHGVLVDAVFNMNASCEILPSVLDTARSALDSVKLDNITSVIIVVDEDEATKCGCETIGYTSTAIGKLRRHMNAKNSFSIDTMLYVIYQEPGPNFGAYTSLPYYTFYLEFAQSDSSINIALLSRSDYQKAVGISKKLNTAIIATVNEDVSIY